MADTAYIESLQGWRSRLDDEIRGERGPLALGGLYWLEPGINTVGSSPDCTICLPKPIPRLLGAFEFDGSRVKFHADVGQTVEINGVTMQSAANLHYDDEAGASTVRKDDVTLALTRHAGRVGVRLWNADRARAFPPRSWFDPNPDYIIQGNYTGYPAPVKIKIPDSLGETQDGYVQGYVTFKLRGKSHSLDAAETDDGRLFLQFKDVTGGSTTYAGGRYLETDPVSEDGLVSLDFNRAYNPPSAFSEFAPCSLAPKANTLNCAVEAGERYLVPG
jgi:hypothetical protein